MPTVGWSSAKYGYDDLRSHGEKSDAANQRQLRHLNTQKKTYGLGSMWPSHNSFDQFSNEPWGQRNSCLIYSKDNMLPTKSEFIRNLNQS